MRRLSVRGATVDIERITALLELDECQRKHVKRIFDDRQQVSYVDSFQELESYRTQIWRATRNNLKKVLTERQLSQLQLLMQGMEGKLVVRELPNCHGISGGKV